MVLVACLFFARAFVSNCAGFLFLPECNVLPGVSCCRVRPGWLSTGVMLFRSVVGTLLYDLIVADGRFPRTFGLIC